MESARLVTLSAPARHVVELMAIGGQRLPLRVVTVASDLAPEALDAGVDELVDARLLVEVGGTLPTYEFVHAIVRDSVAQTVRRRREFASTTGWQSPTSRCSRATGDRCSPSWRVTSRRRRPSRGRRRPCTTPGVRRRKQCGRSPTTRRSPISSRLWRSPRPTRPRRSTSSSNSVRRCPARATTSRRCRSSSGPSGRRANEGWSSRRCRLPSVSTSPCRCRGCPVTSRFASCRRRSNWWARRTARCAPEFRHRWRWRSLSPGG